MFDGSAGQVRPTQSVGSEKGGGWLHDWREEERTQGLYLGWIGKIRNL
jgi:hypothetical protein